MLTLTPNRRQDGRRDLHYLFGRVPCARFPGVREWKKGFEIAHIFARHPWMERRICKRCSGA